MKTFADYLPTMTAREREILEAFRVAENVAYHQQLPSPLQQMRDTPPAKELGSVEVQVRYELIASKTHVRLVFDLPEQSAVNLNLQGGDRVRVTKLEGGR